MASIRVGGLGSGLDVNGLLSQLREAEEMKLQPLYKEKTANDGKISAFGSLKSALTRLQDATKAMNESKTFNQLKTDISGSGVSVVAGADAKAGSYTVKVNSLASAHMMATVGVASRTEGIAGTGVLSLQIGSNEAVDIDIAEGSSLEQIRNAINSSDSGVTATIINTGDATEPHRLVFSSDKTGTDAQMSMSFSGSGDLQALLSDGANGGTMVETQAAANASLTVNGMQITSQSNTVSDAIQGVTMQVNQVGETQRLDVSTDDDKVKASVNEFVSAYNNYITLSKRLTEFNPDPALSGALIGDSTLRGIDNRIRSVLVSPEETGTFSVMAEFGVKLDNTGKLTVDDAVLSEALATQPDAVSSFFTGETYNTGFASRLNNQLESMLMFEGTLEIALEGLDKRAKSINETFDRDMDRIDIVIERYRVQFAAMDSMVGSMNSMMTYLEQQFKAMAAQTKQ